ncbi:MAG: glycosyltransferase family 4 protein [Patescibacteria group bacterium]
MKVLFLFNQLLVEEFSSGGDVKGFTIFEEAMHDESLHPGVMCSAVAKKSFSVADKYLVGNSFVESIFDRKFVPFIFVLYFFRAIEAISLLSKVSTNVIYTTGDFFCNVLPAYKYKKNNPAVIWCACVYHINESPFNRKSNFFLRSLISYLMQKYSFSLIKKKADLIFVLNEGVKKSLINLGFKNKIVVSGLGLNTSEIKNKVNSYSKSDFKYKNSNLVFFNRVNPTKGVFDLPKILSEVKLSHSDAYLHIIGSVDPSIKNKLNVEFAALSCENSYKFHGFLPKNDVYKIISESKVFLQTSYEEGWSLVLFEGIMCRTIPVVYDLPVYREVFKNTLNIAPLGDIAAFVNLINEVLDLNKSEYEKTLHDCYTIAASYDNKQVYEKEKLAIESLKNERIIKA